MRKSYSRNFYLAIGVVILFVGAFWFWQNDNSQKYPTLEEAGKMGEKATHKLLVQIETPKGNPEDLSGRYERGDIVLIFPASHEFSPAEKEGFLILQMDLTSAQAEILTRAKEEEQSFLERLDFDQKDSPKTLKRRKFTIDLAKIGIASEDQSGREIEKRIFEWSAVVEK